VRHARFDLPRTLRRLNLWRDTAAIMDLGAVERLDLLEVLELHEVVFDTAFLSRLTSLRSLALCLSVPCGVVNQANVATRDLPRLRDLRIVEPCYLREPVNPGLESLFVYVNASANWDAVNAARGLKRLCLKCFMWPTTLWNAEHGAWGMGLDLPLLEYLCVCTRSRVVIDLSKMPSASYEDCGCREKHVVVV
jgi:hypothetical protein